MTNAAIIVVVIAFSMAVAAMIVRFAPKGPETSEKWIIYQTRRSVRFWLTLAPFLIAGFILLYFFG